MITKEIIVDSILKDIEFFLKKDGIKLPSEGIIAGQSLATLYLNKIRFNNYRNQKKLMKINDIDVFEYNFGYDNDEKIMMEKKSKIKMDMTGYKFESYSETKYIVTKTKKEKTLNTTSINFVSVFDELLEEGIVEKELIKCFDINVTQIAYNIKTKKLYMSEEFKEFIKTGQLKIVDISTPHHTAIRFVDKMETHGFYGDVEKELFKCKIAIEKKLTRSNFFGMGYRNKYIKYSTILNNYFTLREYTFKPIVKENILGDKETFKRFSLKQKVMRIKMLEDELKRNKQKYRLFELSYNFTEKELNKIGSLSRFEGLTSNKDIVSFIENRSKTKLTVLEYNDSLFNELSERYSDVLYAHTFLRNIIYMDNKIKSKKDLEHIMKFLRDHSTLLRFFYGEDIETCMVKLTLFKKIAKKYNYFYLGILEKMSMSSDNFSLRKWLRFARESMINKSEIFDKNIIFKPIKTKEWSLTQLNSGLDLDMEALRMNNCVDGYVNSCKNKDIVILSLINNKDKILRLTIEIKFTKEYTYKIVQIKYVNNGYVEDKRIEEIKKVLNLSFDKEILKNSEYSLISKEKKDLSIDLNEDEIPF